MGVWHTNKRRLANWWGRLWREPYGAAVPEEVLATLPDMILQMGADGILRHIRPPKGNTTLVDPQQHEGKHITEIGLPDSLAHMIWQRVLEAINTGELVQTEYDLELDGVVYRREMRCMALNREAAVLVVRDITAQAQAHHTLHQQSQAQHLLVHISSMLLDVSPAEYMEKMAQVLLAVGRLYQLDCVAMMEIQESGETIATTHLWSVDRDRTAEFAQTPIPLTHIPNVFAQLQMNPPRAVRWSQPAGEALPQAYLNYFPCTSALILPILYRKILVGALFLGRWRPPIHWTEESIQQMHLLADILVAGLVRTKTEQALRDYANELEARVVARTAELRQTNAELQRALRAKDEFFSTMSHELRTPLHAVIGLSQALQEQVRGTLNERQLHTVQIIEQSGYRLLQLINNILDLAKLETGKLPLRVQPFAVSQLVESCVEGLRKPAESKHILLTAEVAVPLMQLQTDFQRAQQVVSQLLSNALKFTEANGRVTLTVWLDEPAQEVVWQVADTGIGIAEEDLARIFEPFVQLDSSLARQHEGTGLGLGLAAKVARLLGGRLTAVSTPGAGSTFTFYLPLVAPQSMPPPRPSGRG